MQAKQRNRPPPQKPRSRPAASAASRSRSASCGILETNKKRRRAARPRWPADRGSRSAIAGASSRGSRVMRAPWMAPWRFQYRPFGSRATPRDSSDAFSGTERRMVSARAKMDKHHYTSCSQLTVRAHGLFPTGGPLARHSPVRCYATETFANLEIRRDTWRNRTFETASKPGQGHSFIESALAHA